MNLFESTFVSSLEDLIKYMKTAIIKTNMITAPVINFF